MDDEQDRLILETHFGMASPCWRLGGDSNALELAAVRGMTNVSIALKSDQAAQIRSFTGVTSHLLLDISIFGDPMRLHLVGKKCNQTEWAGTASAYTDTESVARDLAHGLSCAEQVVSEVNSLVAILDRNGNVQRFNRMCEEVTGMREEDVVGKSAYALFMSPEQAEKSKQNISNFFATKEPCAVERYINTVKGPRLFLFRNKFVRSGSGADDQFLICSGTDITEERKARHRLFELANTDGLTGLPNRNAINEKIEAALAGTGGSPQSRIGILFLDLDNFKRVNDHYGHAFGDRLLKEVSDVIKGCLPNDATLARLGGDEFLVLLDNATNFLLEETAQRVLMRLRTPFHLDLMEIYGNCSIGIALYPEHGNTLERLIRSADTAMYAAKYAGKHTYRFFSAEMDWKVAEDLWLDTNLRKALVENQFVLHYQPLINIVTGKVHGAEALIRWHSPERGLVPPTEFIGYAEGSGLIGPLGRWVMKEAATQAAKWKAKGLDIRISVNVSARQLCDTDIAKRFGEILEAAGLKSCPLDIELTESCFIEDEGTALALMDQFRKLGARIHLDDFGTGYSSLAQLLRIPLDMIKLDRSFIKGIDTNPKSQALVRSIVAVAQALGFSVLAEGVETQAEADVLKRIGVNFVQGFLFARPMAVEDFETWVGLAQKAPAECLNLPCY
ncbi:MAG TPA: cyclic di-GMP phosphodiesterase [Trinickia sp.]|uniref:cyclic di-GMP phosphodiesterase n=1 Tax=Trinickia sp. TaxID=2571163 RepID=UPI002C79B315|nr:cyclic di-GMP phosphodiesterase [Trinickia sp.]HTI18909.1 cyclic di-GMP phosphodiesterase [Trinickia sp.]